MATANCGGLLIDGKTLVVNEITKNLEVRGIAGTDAQNIIYIYI